MLDLRLFLTIVFFVISFASTAQNTSVLEYEKQAEAYFQNSEFKKALETSKKSFELSVQDNNDSLAILALTRMSYSADFLGYYDLCQVYNFQLLEYYKKHNRLSGIASALNDIGIVHYYKEEYDQSLKFAFKALKIYEELNDTSGIAMCYNNIANCQTDDDDVANGLSYYLKSLDLNWKLNDYDGAVMCLGNIGETYFLMENYKEAHQYYKESIRNAIKYNVDEWYLITPYLGESYYFNQINQLDSALHYAKLSISISKRNGYRAETSLALSSLSEIYENANDYKKSLKVFRQHKFLEDSIYKDQSNSRVAELNAKYELNEKDNQIALQKLEIEQEQEIIERNKIIMIVLVTGVLVVLVAIYLLFKENKKRKVVNRLLNEKNSLIEEKNHSITESILYARRIQNAILPAMEDVRESFPKSFIFYKPKDIVSGDFYWHSKQQVVSIIAAVDCTGHGVPGAFMSMMANDLLNQIVLDEHEVHPVKTIELLDKRVKSNLTKSDENAESRDGLDIALCAYNHNTKVLEFAGAKNDLYLLRKDKVEIIKASRFSVGGEIRNKVFEGVKINIEDGDEIYIFTDGFADQFGGNNSKKFTYRRFRQLIETETDSNMNKKLEKFERVFDEWKGNEEQVDDICVIGIRF